MAVFKRIGAQVGTSSAPGVRVATGGLTCPHCFRQTRLVLVAGKNVCQLCGKAPDEK